MRHKYNELKKMQNAEYQQQLHFHKANICAILWRIYKLNGVYTDVGCKCKERLEHIEMKRF